MGSPLRQPLSSTGCDWLTGRQPLRRVDRHRVFFVSSAIVLAALLFPSLGGCDYQAKREVPDPPAVVRQTEAAPIVVDGVKLAKNVQSFCGDCHAPPKAESFSKGQWPREVRRGFEFYTETGRADLTIPREDDVLKYYVDQAPETLPLPQTYPLDRVAEKQFVFTQSAAPRDLKEGTAGANIVSFDGGPPLGQMMMMSDMRNGSIFACGFNGEGFDECKIVAKLQHPCRLVQCDLDGSGQQGLLVSELGSFLPADHALGRVVWFRRNSETELTFDKEVLLLGCGRIADAQVVDLDQDGDLDILYTNGVSFDSYKVKPYHGVRWLENLGDQKFVTRPLQVDGCIHPALCVDDYNDAGIPVIAAANFHEDATKYLPAMDILLATGDSQSMAPISP